MKWLRAFLTLTFFYLLGLLSGVIICGALFLYISISWLHQPHRSDNENVRQLLQWGQIYSAEMNQLEDLRAITLGEQPALCSAICNPSFLSSSEVVESGASFLNEYWQSQKKQAQQDPLFLLAMKKTEVLKDIFPRSLREAILQEAGASKITRIYRAFQLEWDLTVHGIGLFGDWKNLKEKWDQTELYQEGFDTCRKGRKPPAQVVQECTQSLPTL